MNVLDGTSTANYQNVLTFQGENFYLNVVVSIGLLSLISLWGVVANILNLVVFLGQTSQDNVSTGLIALSIADLCLTVTTLLGCIFRAWDLIDPNSAVNPGALYVVVTGYPMAMFYDISTTLIVFVSMERSLCVINPFRVRNILTRRRVVIIAVLIYVFSLAVFSPVIFDFFCLTWVSLNGQSRLLMKRNPKLVFYSQIIGIFKGIFSFTLAQILVFCFSARMIYSLKISYRFRQDSSGGNASSMLRKERILMRTVLFVAILFFISNSGAIMLSFTMLLVPGFSRRGEHAHTYFNVAPLINVLFATSSSFNSIIYFATSSRYRNGIKKIFRKQIRQTPSTTMTTAKMTE